LINFFLGLHVFPPFLIVWPKSVNLDQSLVELWSEYRL